MRGRGGPADSRASSQDVPSHQIQLSSRGASRPARGDETGPQLEHRHQAAHPALLPPVATGRDKPGPTIESSSTALIRLGGRSSSECMALADPRGQGVSELSIWNSPRATLQLAQGSEAEASVGGMSLTSWACQPMAGA